MKVKNLFLIAAGVFMLTTTFTATAKKLPKEVKMTKEVLMDKIKGGWAGKTIGCSYGGPTEFKYSGFMNDEIEIPARAHDQMVVRQCSRALRRCLHGPHFRGGVPEGRP